MLTLRPITRKFEFDAGHRVLGHEGKCANLHGHRYVAEVTVISKDLDELGRVVDFSCLKTLIGAWIDRHWDHNIILHQADPLCATIDNDVMLRHIAGTRAKDILGPKKPYIMPGGRNTTAEEMAEELYNAAVGLLPSELTVITVRIYETPNCWADYAVPAENI